MQISKKCISLSPSHTVLHFWACFSLHNILVYEIHDKQGYADSLPVKWAFLGNTFFLYFYLFVFFFHHFFVNFHYLALESMPGGITFPESVGTPLPNYYPLASFMHFYNLIASTGYSVAGGKLFDLRVFRIHIVSFVFGGKLQ